MLGLGWLAGVVLGGCLSEYAVGMAGSQDCPGIDLASDPDNCGACGSVCPAEQACVQGICGGECLEGVRCERTCTDLSIDPRHCGACDESCGPGEDCIGGVCTDTCDGECDPILKVCNAGTCVCRDGLSFCNGECGNLDNDPNTCGECDVRCLGSACSEGVCMPNCADGLTRCPDGACADVSTDVLHCGACDSPCAADEVCVAGACQGYHLAPCEQCPCEGCGTDACCPDFSGPRCVAGGECP